MLLAEAQTYCKHWQQQTKHPCEDDNIPNACVAVRNAHAGTASLRPSLSRPQKMCRCEMKPQGTGRFGTGPTLHSQRSAADHKTVQSRTTETGRCYYKKPIICRANRPVGASLQLLTAAAGCQSHYDETFKPCASYQRATGPQKLKTKPQYVKHLQHGKPTQPPTKQY
jgi:hypothetical protein